MFHYLSKPVNHAHYYTTTSQLNTCTNVARHADSQANATFIYMCTACEYVTTIGSKHLQGAARPTNLLAVRGLHDHCYSPCTQDDDRLHKHHLYTQKSIIHDHSAYKPNQLTLRHAVHSCPYKHVQLGLKMPQKVAF